MPNKFITIENPTGIFVMLNPKEEEVYLCHDCMIVSDKHGYVDNTEDCEHGKAERIDMNCQRCIELQLKDNHLRDESNYFQLCNTHYEEIKK